MIDQRATRQVAGQSPSYFAVRLYVEAVDAVRLREPETPRRCPRPSAHNDVLGGGLSYQETCRLGLRSSEMIATSKPGSRIWLARRDGTRAALDEVVGTEMIGVDAPRRTRNAGGRHGIEQLHEGQLGAATALDAVDLSP